MAYDEELANRVRALLAAQDAVSEVRMFGGLAFLVGGHMAVAVSSRGGLMLRVGSEAAAQALARPHAAPVEMRGRPMVGWIRVAPAGLKSTPQLASWVRRGVAFAATLPPKR